MTADVVFAVGVVERAEVEAVGYGCCGLWWADSDHRRA